VTYIVGETGDHGEVYAFAFSLEEVLLHLERGAARQDHRDNKTSVADSITAMKVGDEWRGDTVNGDVVVVCTALS
jgi:hypothetical protein